MNTISSNYSAAVRAKVYLAKSRKYPSARASALADNFVPEEVYDNLIENVRAGVGPLQDYVSLRKKILGIPDFHFYDFFVPIVPDVDRSYSYEEGKELVLKAAAILGEDYTTVMKRAVNERWIDVLPGKNKRTGAYSNSCYDEHPYMLLNYTDTLEDVFTLIHELGHSMHSYFSNQNQPVLDADYSIFCAEVASTTNEMLLYHYLLERAETKEQKTLLLAKHLDDIRSTFYRQTMFADFENQTHKLAEAGEPLTPTVLCGIHQKLNADYYGPEFVADPIISWEWARIPHFYRNFYVYQYATGISAAIAISRRILSEGQPAVDDYRKFLATGRQRPSHRPVADRRGRHGVAQAHSGHHRRFLGDPRTTQSTSVIEKACPKQMLWAGFLKKNPENFYFGLYKQKGIVYNRKAESLLCGCGSMVELQLPKLETRVRFPSSAPKKSP